MRLSPIFCILLLAVVTSCLDEIELEIPKGLDENIDIRGELIMGDPAEITVYLENVFNFETSSLLAVRARFVELIDAEGNRMEIPSIRDGVYYYQFSNTTDPIKIAFDQQYKIRVALFNGQTFESEFERMPRPVGKGQMSVKRTMKSRLDDNGSLRNFDFASFFINAPLQTVETGEFARLHWVPQRTFRLTDSAFIAGFVPTTCYITNSIDITNTYLFDATVAKSDFVNDFPLSELLLNFEFAEGYYYTIFQRSLSEGSFNYWKQVQQTFAADGNIFSPPVGRITSNIRDVDDPEKEAFGYFSALSQDTVRLYVPPSTFNIPSTCPRQPVMGMPCPFLLCCDCASEAGSQTTRPDFWEE
ncbi:MAG: DUF4249 family protein [Bacteroidota bacterium]